MKGKISLWVAAACAAMALLMALGGQSRTADTQEERIAKVLSAISGAGRVEVALFGAQKENEPPTGAVVVAEGAADIGVKLQLIRAVRTLLGLPENAVDVFVMGEDYP